MKAISPAAFAAELSRSTAATVARPRVARLLLPREHGSWALAFEPLALGLLAAPSLAGAALTLAVVAGFFARTPCKVSLEGKTPRERIVAHRLLLLLTLIVAAGIGAAAGLRGFSALWPLLPALPCGGLFLSFDLRNDARAGVAEVAGAAAFACVPGALATLAGLAPVSAFALTSVMLVRAVPTVLVIRACLRRRKGRPAAPWFALATAWIGAAVVGVLAVSSLTGWLPLVLASVLALRATWLLSPWAPAWSAKRLGIMEAVLGAAYVVGCGMSF